MLQVELECVDESLLRECLDDLARYLHERVDESWLTSSGNQSKERFDIFSFIIKEEKCFVEH